MRQTIRLLGELGERHGTVHVYHNLRTPADAIKLLCVNSPAFQNELVTAHEHGIGYRLIQAGEDLDLSDLHLPVGSNDLLLAPVVAGSGGGVGKVIAGAALVVAAILIAPAAGGFLGIGGAGLFGAGSTAAVASTLIGAVGTSLIFGGVAQLLAPQPVLPNVGSSPVGTGSAVAGGLGRFKSGESLSTDGPQSVTRGADGRQSYAFTGPANTVGVGATIPVVYGEVVTGSHLLSADIDVADESDPVRTSIKDPGLDTIRIGGEKITGSLTSASGILTATWSSISGSYIYGTFLDLPVSRGSLLTTSAIPLQVTSFNTFLKLEKLIDLVSGAGTTQVDGFITYRLRARDAVNNNIFGQIQGTIQGLFSQTYRWYHRWELGYLGGRSIVIDIDIVDASVDGLHYLELEYIGHSPVSVSG